MGSLKEHGVVTRRLGGAFDPHSPVITGVVEVWREARRGRLQFLLDLHDREEDRAHLCGVILAKNEVWIGQAGERIVGFIAFADGWVNHLYVSPPSQGRGVGSELLAVAQRAAASLQLWAFEENTSAIGFYQSRGFRIVERTDGSANEARRPDVRMEWIRGAAEESTV